MTEVKHTPLVVGGHSGKMVLDNLGTHIANCGTQEEAHMFVKCVNLHDDLVGTIQELLKVYSEPDEDICCNGFHCGCQGASVRQQAEHYAREALKKAGAL